MRILILQHSPAIDGGILRAFLDEEGHVWEVVDLGGDLSAIPDAGHDALWVTGNALDVVSDAAQPFVEAAAATVRELVGERGLPYLGIGFGHQLLALALGGEIGPSERPAPGVGNVQLTEAGATGILFDDFPEVFQCFHWHGAEVTRLPEGAQVLATSPDCAVQAMRWGTRAHSLQFHFDVDLEALIKSDPVPAGQLQQIDRTRLIADLTAHGDAFERLAERLLINWMQTAARA